MTHLIRSVLALVLVTGCSSKDPGEQPSGTKSAPTGAKTAIDKQGEELATQQVELERNQKEQAADQQTRATYQASVRARLAKLDAALAATKDVPAGLRARRDELSLQIAEMPATSGTSWAAYTKGVDAAFVSIETDLRPN